MNLVFGSSEAVVTEIQALKLPERPAAARVAQSESAAATEPIAPV